MTGAKRNPEEEEHWEDDHFAKASTWYHVPYHPDYFHYNDQLSAVTKVNLHLLSFPSGGQ